jgi:hypothetical protein
MAILTYPPDHVKYPPLWLLSYRLKIQSFSARDEQCDLLLAWRDIAAVGYRATHRRPDLYSPEVRSWWAHAWAATYDLLEAIAHERQEVRDDQ